MKKIFLALMLVIIVCSCVFGAENEDVYVRKDLFESYMKNIDSKLDIIMKEQALMREDIKTLTQAIADLNARVTRVETRIDGVEKRFDDLRTGVNIGIALIGLIAILLALPVVQNWWERRREARRQTFTLEDIEKLIDAKLKGNLTNAV